MLSVALISYLLARRLKLPAQQCTTTLIAGLAHDLGELHTDPSLLDRRHRLSAGELCHINVHPITGYLIAREIVGDNPPVATAILQHHEKLDGSGYPYRLRGEAIGPIARILAVAEVSASIIARVPGSERLSTWMRLNREKFDPSVIALLQQGLDHDDGDADDTESLDLEEMKAVAHLLRRWHELSSALRGKPPPELVFLFERMAGLRIVLLQFGFDPDHPQSLQALVGEREIASELAAAFDEVR